jgi:hypothetical protein
VTELSQAALVAMSTWIDDGNARRLVGQSWEQLEAEVILLHRTIKVAEELGEAVTNLIGFTGANPRKGTLGTEADILAELLDVAVTALGAYEHIDGNRGRSMAALDAKIVAVAKRAGVLS